MVTPAVSSHSCPFPWLCTWLRIDVCMTWANKFSVAWLYWHDSGSVMKESVPVCIWTAASAASWRFWGHFAWSRGYIMGRFVRKSWQSKCSCAESSGSSKWLAGKWTYKIEAWRYAESRAKVINFSSEHFLFYVPVRNCEVHTWTGVKRK